MEHKSIAMPVWFWLEKALRRGKDEWQEKIWSIWRRENIVEAQSKWCQASRSEAWLHSQKQQLAEQSGDQTRHWTSSSLSVSVRR